MSERIGVPLEGGPADAFTRERASATPTHLAQRAHRTSGELGVPRRPIQPVKANLKSLQSWFAAAITHPIGVAESVHEQGAFVGEASPSPIEAVVLPSARLSALERMEIYHEAYRARLVECLADDYPSVQYALGDEAFAALCYDYMNAHPSRSPSLNGYGRAFAEFCRTSPGPHAVFAADLSSLEWAMVEVLHAASAETLSVDALATIAPSLWGSARLPQSTSVRILEFSYPVNAFFQAHRLDESPSIPEASWSATAVFRDGEKIWRMDLNPAMLAILRGLFANQTLEQALTLAEGSGALEETDASSIMVWFRDWVAHGFFAGIQLEE